MDVTRLSPPPVFEERAWGRGYSPLIPCTPPTANYTLLSNYFSAVLKLSLNNDSVAAAVLVNEALLSGYFHVFVAVTRS